MDPALLYCVGATKAGTSWLYRTLHEHEDCHLKAVKELHYWDTFDPAESGRVVDMAAARLAAFRTQRDEAEAAGRGWQVQNMTRRIRDTEAQIAVLTGDRSGDRAYLGWLTDGAEGRLVADMTPSYALLPHERLLRMAALSTRALFVYLVRDPVARLWSHVRMQAQRQRLPHEEFEAKANGIMRRILNKGHEAHILARGDYPATVARLTAALPAERLRVVYCEEVYTEAGQQAMAEFLGIRYRPADGAAKAHEGPKAALSAELAAKAVRFLKDHYDWAARTIGPLPPAWADTLARA